MRYTLVRVLGLFVAIEGEAGKYGFFATVFIAPGTLEEDREAVRAAIVARMERHGVHVSHDGASRSFCIMRELHSVERDEAYAATADGFTFFNMKSWRARLSGVVEAAWNRWRKPEYVLI